MSDKDQCRAAFEACCKLPLDRAGHKIGKEAGPYLEHDTRWAWQSWVDCWSHQSAALAARDAEIARFNTAFLEGCDERDHWHSRALIGDSKEITLRDEIARLRQAISLAYEAMNHMGDILNAHDMAEPESVEQVTPAFEAVRAALSQPASAPAAIGS